MNQEKPGAARWRNPRYVDNEGAQRAAKAQLLGSALRSRVAGGCALGTFVLELPTPSTLTALAFAGFDFVVLDMEHSAVDFTRLEMLIVAGQAAGLAVLVRPWGEDVGLIGKILDNGANGVMVPRVETPERARMVVDQARFPPAGSRGFSPLSRYDALREPLTEMNDSTYLVLQIEGRQALERVGEIAAVPGVDAIFIGPNDLALSLGLAPGGIEVYEAAAGVADRVEGGTGLGIYVDDPARCGDWVARRFGLLCVSFDGRMLSTGARAAAAQAREAIRGKSHVG